MNNTLSLARIGAQRGETRTYISEPVLGLFYNSFDIRVALWSPYITELNADDQQTDEAIFRCNLPCGLSSISHHGFLYRIRSNGEWN